VLALHGQGHGPCRIARATGISRKQVARLLESEGITGEPSQPASARLPEILELRRQGHGFTTIGRRLGFSRNEVRQAMQQARDASGQTNAALVAGAVADHLPRLVEGLQALVYGKLEGKRRPARLPFSTEAGTLQALREASDQVPGIRWPGSWRGEHLLPEVFALKDEGLSQGVADRLGLTGRQGRCSRSAGLAFVVLGMGFDQSHTQLVDLGQEGPQASVFGQPSAHLIEQVKGDVNGASLALVLEGEVPGGVQRSTLLAVAGRPAAVFADLGEAGGQDRLAPRELGQAGIEHAADHGRVLGHAHTQLHHELTAKVLGLTRIRSLPYPKKAEKPQCEEKSWRPGQPPDATLDLSRTYVNASARRIRHLSTLAEVRVDRLRGG
jgi:hypothetical protein